MQKRTPMDIDRFIELASFEVTGEERERLRRELEEFLDYARILNEAPCADLVPSAHAVEKDPLLRDDVAEGWENMKDLLECGPEIRETAYLVPPQKGRTGGEKDPATGGALRESAAMEAVIGLEVHAQMRTGSKLFCSCSTEFGAGPNRNTCPVCSGHPGVLPVLNRQAVRMAVLAGLAMNSRINKRSVFARKNYFYPDLPKGYQISQFEEPLCSGGYVEIETGGDVKRVRLNRIHVEEDAGKMVHVGAPGIWGSKASAVDLNRTGVPLIEIVSEPDISSPAEAREYVVMLRSVLMALGICDGNMEEGSLRCDANVSLRPAGSGGLGVKTEIKNMNSFKAIERALLYEIERQMKMIGQGLPVTQETRLWDDGSQKTLLMRSKEESHDYRYFPDPDLLPLELDEDWIEGLRERLPLPPLERKRLYQSKYSMTAEEARLFMVNPSYAVFFERVLGEYDSPRRLANWFFSEILSHVSGDLGSIHIEPGDFAGFLRKIDSGEISGKIGKSVIRKAFGEKRGLLEIIESDGLRRISDPGEVKDLVRSVLEENGALVESYRGGNRKLFGFLVGKVMQASGGKADPALVNRCLTELLDG